MTSEATEAIIAAILANRPLVRRLGRYHQAEGVVYRPIDREALRVAWSMLSDQERLLWTLRHGLDGQEPRSQQDIVERTGLTLDKVDYREADIARKLREDIWVTHEFRGLKRAELNLLLRANITTLSELQNRINELFKTKPYGWGPGRFRTIETWLIDNGHPSLIPSLNEDSRRALGMW